MKRYILITLLIISIFSLYSCKERELTYFELETAAALTNPVSGGTFVLTDVDADNVFQTFVWTEAIYNVDVTVTYDIEVDLKANNFSDPFVLATTENDSMAVTVFDFNKFLTVDMGLEPGVAQELSIRVVSYAKTSDRSNSAAIDMTVTPYDPPYAPAQLYVITNEVVVGKLKPIDSDGNYQGYAWLGIDSLEFILSENVDGSNPLGEGSPAGTLVFEGTNITVSEDGHYKVDVNTYQMTFEAFEQEWGIIGSAIPNYDWAADINMAYIGDGKWEISTDTISDPVINGEFKFRPNDSWNPLNYGDGPTGDNPQFVFDGVPDEYGANIPITAGSWKITLDLNEFPYLYTVTPIVK